MFLTALLASAPIVIAHRGASSELPEHTLAAYTRAIDLGADFIEPDVVITKDGVLIARHENEISGTTDVVAHPEFADRKATKEIDGAKVTGWFTEDFTLAELKTLKSRERLPQVRPESAKSDGKFEIPTLKEVLELVRQKNEKRRNPVGIYPETKHPSYFRKINLPLEEPLVKILAEFAYDEKSPAFIQSFEVGNLKWLKEKTKVRLIQLVTNGGKPEDGSVSYAQMLSNDGLRAISTYAAGIGVEKSLVIPVKDGALAPATDLVKRAHEAKLLVHIWTLRPENLFLPKSLAGKPEEEHRAFLNAGIDGFFSDAPGLSVRVRNEWLAQR